MNEKYMLEVNDLVKYFPVKGSKKQVVHAVDGVSFKIKKEKWLGLVGKPGAGKSTWAGTIKTIKKRTTGEVKKTGEKKTKKTKKK